MNGPGVRATHPKMREALILNGIVAVCDAATGPDSGPFPADRRIPDRAFPADQRAAQSELSAVGHRASVPGACGDARARTRGAAAAAHGREEDRSRDFAGAG